MKQNKKQKQFLEIAILGFIIVISFFLWDTIVVFPIKLFVVLMHEISHGIAAILTGGKIISMEINLNLGGKLESEGGIPFIIASAGYIGSFIFGAALFYSAYNKNHGVTIISSISIIILLFAVNVIEDFRLSLISILSASLLFIISKFSPDKISSYIFKMIGLISCLYVLFDIKEDILSDSSINSDASVISEISGIPENVWGFIWLLISIVGIILLLRYSYKKGIK